MARKAGEFDDDCFASVDRARRNRRDEIRLTETEGRREDFLRAPPGWQTYELVDLDLTDQQKNGIVRLSAISGAGKGRIILGAVPLKRQGRVVIDDAAKRRLQNRSDMPDQEDNFALLKAHIQKLEP
ncbi:MAG: hypothetical protein H7124_18010 [Phycisphaerales bacterium]|nr:hypothetical protein [Hyphomonadaceae bacterium]